MIPTLQTERLILRSLSFSDREAMIEAIMSDKDVMHWLPCSDAVSTPEGQKEVASGYLEDFIKPWEMGYGIWAVCIRTSELGTTDNFIGYCGFLPGQIQDAGPEIAYALKKSIHFYKEFGFKDIGRYDFMLGDGMVENRVLAYLK
ncbi:MAG: GNAT family N-acetyltransferase [Desulfobacteraceae bacterium]